MSATMCTAQTAMVACQSRTQRMPSVHSSMPAMCTMYMASASILIIGTDVNTPVSLFIVLLVEALLLVSFVVLISLILTGLTGLGSRESLVGQTDVTAGLMIYTTRPGQGD